MTENKSVAGEEEPQQKKSKMEEQEETKTTEEQVTIQFESETGTWNGMEGRNH